ncbi:Thioredoxin family protein [Minicystis rosea]|nr:Thioredoxin family protein [Minicystis rosea]
MLGAGALISLAVLPRLVPETHGMVGKPAPDVVLSVAANGQVGKELRLADLKGQAVLLDFWASWCGPCAMEAPVVDRVARRFEKKGLVVMGVNVDDTPEVIRAYTAKKKLGYQMVIGRDASRKYGVEKLPSLVVIDRQGNVQAFLTGMVDEESLSEIVGAAM